MNNKIKVTDACVKVTATDKEISFTYKGKEYEVLLHWNTYDGGFMEFIGETPDWAEDWDDENDESLEFLLDDLSEEVIQEQKVSK